MSMTEFLPPRGVLKILYKKMDSYSEYSVVFATDTKRFYMKLYNTLVAITPPIDEMNAETSNVCKNCGQILRFPSIHTSVAQCTHCGYVNDMYMRNKVEAAYIGSDAKEYIGKEISKIVNEDPSKFDIFGSNFEYINNNLFKVTNKSNKDILYTYPRVEGIHKFKDIENPKEFYTNNKFQLVVTIRNINKRNKIANRKIEVLDIFFLYESSKVTADNDLYSDYKDAIRDFTKYIKELKEEYQIEN